MSASAAPTRLCTWKMFLFHKIDLRWCTRGTSTRRTWTTGDLAHFSRTRTAKLHTHSSVHSCFQRNFSSHIYHLNLHFIIPYTMHKPITDLIVKIPWRKLTRTSQLPQSCHKFGHSLIRSTITIQEFQTLRLPWWCRIFMFTNQISQFFVTFVFRKFTIFQQVLYQLVHLLTNWSQENTTLFGLISHSTCLKIHIKAFNVRVPRLIICVRPNTNRMQAVRHLILVTTHANTENPRILHRNNGVSTLPNHTTRFKTRRQNVISRVYIYLVPWMCTMIFALLIHV